MLHCNSCAVFGMQQTILQTRTLLPCIVEPSNLYCYCSCPVLSNPAQVELDASLQREGRGLKLQFNRIDGVLRLREDD